MMHTFKKLKKDSFFYFLGKLLPAAIGLASVSIFVRLIGKGMYGHYTLVFSLVLILNSVGSGWLSQGVLRFMTSYGDDDKRDLKEGVYLGSIYSFLLTGILLALALPFISEISFGLMAVCVILLFLGQIYSIKISFAQVELSSLKLLVAEVVRVAVGFAVTIGIILIFGHTNYMVILYGALAGFLVSWLAILGGQVLPRRAVINKKIMAKIFAYGWPFTLWFAFSYLLNVSDRYLIGYFDGVEAVGVYSAVYDVVFKSLTFVMAPIALAAHPLITLLWNKQEYTGAAKVLSRSVKLQLGLFILSLPVIYYGSAYITYVVLGAHDEMASKIVLPVAIGSFIWQLAMLVHKPLELELSTKRMAVFAGVALAANFAANIVLIPRYGYIAAAYTTIMGATVYFLLVFKRYMLFFSRTRQE